jgi:hypothetical protein
MKAALQFGKGHGLGSRLAAYTHKFERTLATAICIRQCVFSRSSSPSRDPCHGPKRADALRAVDELGKLRTMFTPRPSSQQ